MSNGHPPFHPKYIFAHKKASDYPLYAELRERYPHASFEEFEGDHRRVPQLQGVRSERFLKTKTDTLILAVRGVREAISENANKANSDFIFAGIGYGCLFGCAYCYTNLNKLWHMNVAPLTLYANIDEILKYLIDHQRRQGRQVLYDFSCNNDSIAEGAFFSSTSKTVETIAKTENAHGICTTKATNIEYLLNLNHNGRITIKITLAPPIQIRRFEFLTGSLDERMIALNRLKEAGYNVGINFSPIVLKENWLEDYTDLFRFIDANLIDAAKENLIGEAFFYTHRKVLQEKLSVFKKQFAVLHNPNEYPTKPKRMGVHHYRDLNKSIEEFKMNLEQYLPYFQLRYIF